MAVFLASLQQLSNFTNNSSTYLDEDVSAYVPSIASGVILRVYNSGSADANIGLRKKVSYPTDDIYGIMMAGSVVDFYVGLDSNQVFQYKVDSANFIPYIVGYFTTDAVFFDTAVNKAITAGGTRSWRLINFPEVPSSAKYAIVEVNCSAIGHAYNIMFVEEVPKRRAMKSNGKGSMLVPLVGENREAVYNVEDSDIEFHVRGYILHGFNDGLDPGNRDDPARSWIRSKEISPTLTGWQDVNLAGIIPTEILQGVAGVIIEPYESVDDSTIKNFDVRKKGETKDLTSLLDGHKGFQLVGVDENHKIQVNVDNLDIDVYIMGYVYNSAHIIEVESIVADNFMFAHDIVVPSSISTNGSMKQGYVIGDAIDYDSAKACAMITPVVGGDTTITIDFGATRSPRYLFLNHINFLGVTIEGWDALGQPAASDSLSTTNGIYEGWTKRYKMLVSLSNFSYRYLVLRFPDGFDSYTGEDDGFIRVGNIIALDSILHLTQNPTKLYKRTIRSEIKMNEMESGSDEVQNAGDRYWVGEFGFNPLAKKYDEEIWRLNSITREQPLVFAENGGDNTKIWLCRRDKSIETVWDKPGALNTNKITLKEIF
jgi:hypothetical protein